MPVCDAWNLLLLDVIIAAISTSTLWGVLIIVLFALAATLLWTGAVRPAVAVARPGFTATISFAAIALGFPLIAALITRAISNKPGAIPSVILIVIMVVQIASVVMMFWMLFASRTPKIFIPRWVRKRLSEQ